VYDGEAAAVVWGCRVAGGRANRWRRGERRGQRSTARISAAGRSRRRGYRPRAKPGGRGDRTVQKKPRARKPAVPAPCRHPVIGCRA